MVDRAVATMGDCPFLEFRLDYLERRLAALSKLKEFLAENSVVTAIATCRREANGGKFKGTIAAELEVLQKAASGFHLLDLELQTAESIEAAELEKLRSRGVALMVSYHDFQPSRDLDGIFERIRPYEPEFIKIASTARALSDNVVMMQFLERSGDHANVVGLCMGDQGVVSRVLAIRAGSAFTFAAAVEGEETAPGQVAARTLTDLYRIAQIDTATRIYGVVGNPIKHSLSPLMMNTAFHRETVNGVYLALQTSKLTDLLTVVRELPVSGLSVTMPLKQEVLKHLENMDPISSKVGACNTIVRNHDGKLYGFNTDVGGIVRPLEKRLTLAGAKILVLGAGGAARAAVFGLVDKGAEVVILNRRRRRRRNRLEAKAKTIRREQVAKSSFDVIVNATAVGMHGMKAQHILEPKEINARLVFDLVYDPVETPLCIWRGKKGFPLSPDRNVCAARSTAV